MPTWPDWLPLRVVWKVLTGVWRLARGPMLRLSAGPKGPWCVQTQANLPGRAGPVDQVFDGVMDYYRVRVRNEGQQQAHGCHVTLTRLWYVAENTWRELDTWQPVDLNWSGRPGVTRINLSPSEEAYCDVGHVSSNYIQSNIETGTRVIPRTRRRRPDAEQGRFVLDLATVFNAQPNALEDGAYVIELTAYSDDAPTKTLLCDLWYPGAYALITDTHMDRSLGRTVLQERKRPPAVGSEYVEIREA
jgi:hypothetical protein